MGRMQRAKGSAFERLIANMLKPIWPGAKRGIGQARSASEVADVTGLPFWPELKHHRNVSIQAAMRQASNACAESGADSRFPVVISRDNNGPILVTMKWENWFSVMALWEQARNERKIDVKSAFDRYVDEQKKDPEFAEAYEKAGDEIRKS